MLDGTRYGPLRRLVNTAALLVATLAAAAAASLTPAPVAAVEAATRLLVLGDSLAAGQGLAPADAFPAQLERALRARDLHVEVVNAGVSGDTSAGGRARVEWALAERPDAALVELGGNDALRGLDPDATYANLDAILTRLAAAGVRTLLAGMKAPPNLGRDYGARFEAAYARLARAHGVLFYPFFLDGVAAQPALNQGDGLHPNAEGVAVIVRSLLPLVERLVAGGG